MPAKVSKFFWALNALLGVGFLIELAAPQQSSPLDAAVMVLAAVASVAALARQLPLQNVLPAALITGFIGGLAHGLSARQDVAMPFGPVVFNPAAGAKILDTVPWTMPFLWVVAIFNARGMARLILRPWRKVKNYGIWLIGLTTLLAVAFDVALEPFAWHVKTFWLWQHTKIPVTWEGATLLNFLGWACVSLLIMMVATPFTIPKQPVNPSKPDFHPLILWVGALLLFAIGSAEAGLWPAVAADVLIGGVTVTFAIRGVRW
jgi:uncharacterized membrane protein